MPYDNRSYYIILKISLLAKEGQQNNDLSKAITKYVVPKNFLAALKMVSFSQLPAAKKDTIFGSARNFFGPSYFVMALAL